MEVEVISAVSLFALHYVSGKLVFPFVEARDESGVRALHENEHGVVHGILVKPAHSAEIMLILV